MGLLRGSAESVHLAVELLIPVSENTTNILVNAVPEIRVRSCNKEPVRGDGDYVLYWIIAARRMRWNFALDRAVEWSLRLGKPMVIFEALRWDFPWHSRRIRRFVTGGMKANAAAMRGTNASYYPYVEMAPGKGKGLLSALADRASVIVTDEFPCFFLPRMVAAAARKVSVLLEQVDSNGLLPLRAAPKEFLTAFSFRRFLQKQLPEHLLNCPSADPLSRLKGRPLLKTLPKAILRRWPMAALGAADTRDGVESELRGGPVAATKRLTGFLRERLHSYPDRRNEPSDDGSSGLSPYLHFGFISVHEIFSCVAKSEAWKPERVALRANGSRAGWWGMSAAAEAFLDQLITWRELGFNCCHRRRDYGAFESLPAWAQTTLNEHQGDTRAFGYSLAQFENAQTHDPLWNAAQRQLVAEGRMHNYLRML
jgi:deoxyribodipyrimidine photo-lyase